MMVGEMAGKYAAYYNPALPWLKPTALLIEIYLTGDQFNIFKCFKGRYPSTTNIRHPQDIENLLYTCYEYIDVIARFSSQPVVYYH